MASRNPLGALTPDDPCFDVAIIGLGPVGATLANLLAQQGLSVLVLERAGGIYHLPRAVHIDGECLRVFQGMGVADTLLPTLRVSTGMRFVNAAGQLLIDWSRPAEIGPQGWHPSYRFHQPILEQILRDQLRHAERVAVRSRCELFSIEPQTAHVVLRYEDLDTTRLGSARARWVVGCDGARSTVRRFMGTELDDLHSHERWLVVDLILKRERPDLGDHSIQYCDPARPATYVRGVGMRRRWELMLRPDEDPAEMTRPEAIWPLLSRWVTPADATLERPACYTFHAVIAQGWRRERLLIAGDAAHQTPPFMGQGLCAGIRDAANLAWKLGAVVHGRAEPSLLDTYERERAPHAREFIETAVRLGTVIQATDAHAVRQRDAQMISNPLAFRTPQPALGAGAHDGVAPAGQLSEQPRLADGKLLDDRAGPRYALLLTAPPARGAVAHAGPHCTVLVADSPDSQRWLQQHGLCAVLLRPDRYIAGVARRADEVPGLIARWLPKAALPVT